MRIENLLASKGSSVVTVKPGALVRDAVSALVAHRIGALVVSEDGRHIDGIVSERDIVQGLDSNGTGLLDSPVSAIMSTTVYTCSPTDATDSLMATMTEHRVRHIPVVENGELVGIVSIGDVVKRRMEELEKDRKELEDYIHAR